MATAAVNLLGVSGSYELGVYWERKKPELLSHSNQNFGLTNTMQNVSDWVRSDTTATNHTECTECVAGATAVGGVYLFADQSEHASFNARVVPSRASDSQELLGL